MSTKSNISAVIQTSKGPIHLDLFDEATPITVANFVNLSKRGYYNGLTFHRVIDEFMIQGGCPIGMGTGGPGYEFEDECRSDLLHDEPGVLSMANAGPGTNGSQFFITHVPTPWLDQNHTVFGKVQSDVDMEIVNSIKANDKIESIQVEGAIDALFEKESERLAKWNEILDEMLQPS